jgi:beta-N-acetylhexosaminidase
MAVGAFISGCAALSLSDAERRFFDRWKPWGLILFKRNCETPAQIAALTRSFREAVGRAEAPVFIDQEGGRVQRLGPPHWRRYPPARRFGDLFERDPAAALKAARQGGRLIAHDLLALGITADCLPVLDLPQPGSHEVIGDRAYALTPERVALLARAHMAGLEAGGVLPVIKHIPGHGRAAADSHLELPIVTASRAALSASDFLPFAALADAPVAMTAHVVYSAIDSRAPATLSAKVIGEVIRGEIGFEGLLMSDDLSMKALQGSLDDLAAGALRAGCDLVLHCNGDLTEMEAVARAAGTLDGRSLERAQEALGRLRRPGPLELAAALDHLAPALA